MKLNEIKDQFEQLGVGIVGMTYDTPAIIQAFDEKWDIDYPVLRDVDRQHVEAWDIRNEEYGEGTFAYGIPHPGIVLLSPEGRSLAKGAEEGYRTRADWSEVLAQVTVVVGGR